LDSFDIEASGKDPRCRVFVGFWTPCWEVNEPTRAPFGFIPLPSAASGRTPAGGVQRGPRKLLAVITRGMADAALKASSRGTKKWERKDGGRSCETWETRCGGHQELPWYLRGIKDPPIASFLMSSSPTLPFIALALITPDYAFYIRVWNH